MRMHDWMQEIRAHLEDVKASTEQIEHYLERIQSTFDEEGGDEGLWRRLWGYLATSQRHLVARAAVVLDMQPPYGTWDDPESLARCRRSEALDDEPAGGARAATGRTTTYF